MAALVALHLGAFVLLATAAGQQQALWGMGLLAYTLGLRHAFDADHIAAIDNTVRALVHRGRSSLGVGFFFSLGHSSVVMALILLVSFSVRAVRAHIPDLGRLGGVVGGMVSSLFLLVLTVVNLIVLFSLVRSAVRMRRSPGSSAVEGDLDAILAGRGWIVRLVRPLFRLVSHSWHMYPIGLLFGLGFDTATEIAVIALSATTSTQDAIPAWGVLAFPLLFTAGMMLMDTTDSVMMAGAYRWALATPERKIYYNLTVTSISVLAAFVIGGVGLLQLVGQLAHGHGGFWIWVQSLSFGQVGFFLVGLFAVLWGIAFVLWRRSARHGPVDSGGVSLGR